MKRFDILFAQSNKDYVDWITYELEATGLYERIESGPSHNYVLNTDTSDFVLLVLSNAFLDELNQHPEWTFVFNLDPTSKQRLLIPVLIEDCHYRGLLGPIIPIDLTGLSGNEARVVLLKGVSREPRQKPQGTPKFPGGRL